MSPPTRRPAWSVSAAMSFAKEVNEIDAHLRSLASELAQYDAAGFGEASKKLKEAAQLVHGAIANLGKGAS